MKIIYLGIGLAFVASGPYSYAHGSRHSTKSHHHQLSAKQCAHLQSEFDRYEAEMKSLGAHFPRLSSVVNRTIAASQKFVDRLCPPPSPAEPTPDECSVVNTSQTGTVSLGEDSSQNLTNADSPAKVVCMTENACLKIASQAFSVFSASASSRCADTSDTTVVHLSDAEMQTKVNALSGN